MKEKECCKIIAWLQIAWTQKGKWLNSRNDKGQISQKLIQLNQTWEPIGGRRKTPQKSCQEAIEATSNIHRDFSENKLACKSLRVKPIVSKKISCSVYGENVEAIKSDVSELKVNVSMVQKQLDCQQNCTEDLGRKMPSMWDSLPWWFSEGFALCCSTFSQCMSLFDKSFHDSSTEASLMMLCVELGILKTRKAEFSESGMLDFFKCAAPYGCSRRRCCCYKYCTTFRAVSEQAKWLPATTHSGKDNTLGNVP